jgi:hypothetical protein
MSSVYTNIAKKRIEQSTQAVAAPQAQRAEQPTTVAPPLQHTELEVKQEKEDISRNRDVMTSARHDVNHRTWRDVIENTETHNSSFRITNNEKYAVRDLVDELERKFIVKTSLNELARLGLLYILDDFKKDKLNSLIIKAKKS